MINVPDALLDYLQTLAFRGNNKLRRAGSSVEYTKEMLDEMKKCKKDPIYFIKNYIYIVHPDRGLVKFDLHPYQEKMIRTYHENKRVIFLTARQQGKTTVSAAYFVWYILFNKNKEVAIFANKQSTADEIMNRVRRAYENLPKWMQQGVKVWNKRSVELENDSKVYGRATAASGNRGGSVNILYLDEFAFVENNQADEFFTSVYPTLTAGKKSKVFMTSTPHGYNHFHKFWVEAEKSERGEKGGNGFKPLRIHWWETPGRDQAWYDEQKAVLGDLKAAQELDAEFLGSGKTLLTGAVLARLSFDTPIKEFIGQEKGLKIYKYPEKDHKYTMSVDVSRGRHLDYSAFTVFDVTQYPHRIVATYRNNEIAPLLYASLVHKIARNYHDAYTLIEINDIGAQVADTMWMELEYEAMFWTKAGDMLGKTGTDPYPGIRTTKKTKRIGCANLKDMIDNQQLIINDYDMIQELSTFVQSGEGSNPSYEADEGFHDDTVATLWLHAWMASQPWFKDLTDSDVRLKLHEEHIKEMEDELMMPTILDGTEEYTTRDPESGAINVNWIF